MWGSSLSSGELCGVSCLSSGKLSSGELCGVSCLSSGELSSGQLCGVSCLSSGELSSGQLCGVSCLSSGQLSSGELYGDFVHPVVNCPSPTDTDLEVCQGLSCLVQLLLLTDQVGPHLLQVVVGIAQQL